MHNFFDDLVYSHDDVITFPDGLPGFEGNKPFVVVSSPQLDPLAWLVCTDGSQLRFAIVNPMMFAPDYCPKFPKKLTADAAGPDDLVVYCIVTLRSNPLESTANLAAPILINKTSKIGMQVITDDERYTTQEPIVRGK